MAMSDPFRCRPCREPYCPGVLSNAWRVRRSAVIIDVDVDRRRHERNEPLHLLDELGIADGAGAGNPSLDFVAAQAEAALVFIERRNLSTVAFCLPFPSSILSGGVEPPWRSAFRKPRSSCAILPRAQ